MRQARLLIPGAPRRRLGARLSRVAMGSAGLALVVAGTLLNITVYFWSRSVLQHDLQVQLRVVAAHLAAEWRSDEPQAAINELSALQLAPDVVRATMLDANGVPFAVYQQPGAPPPPALPVSLRPGIAAEQALFSQGRLYVSVPVLRRGWAVGRLELVVTLYPLLQRTLVFAAITGLSGVAALGLAYLLAVGVRREVEGAEQRLDELAFIDPVTGLYNRAAANQHLQGMVERARQLGEGFGLMLLDLDDFKLINDTLGHAVGDEVLKLLGQRLRHGLRASDMVFRFGGDEFIVVSDGPLQHGGGERLGRAAMLSLQTPLQVGAHEIYVRASAGIARFPDDAEDVQALLRAADTAMYGAKAAGKNTFAIYRQDMGGSSHSHLRIDTELRRAIGRDELVLHYQPIVDLASGLVTGAEAVVRWRHPERGLLAPGEFIDVAERSGLIVELGEWVLRAAARQLAAWDAQGLGGLALAVNVSGRQIKRGVLQAQVTQALAEAGIGAERLEIEITEHTLVEDVEANVAALNALRGMGMRIGIDDFGTGLSSLAYLKRLPIDKLKIDRSFVRELPHASDDTAIVSAIVSMARALGLAVVAEGVETVAQRDWLARLGCDLAQGFFYSRAVPAEEFAALLNASQRGADAAVSGAAASRAIAAPSSNTASA
jgi:diguanylate cyclase (GGDEF)-like protein